METEEFNKTMNPNSLQFCDDCPIENGSRIYCPACAKKQMKKLEKFNDEGVENEEDEKEDEEKEEGD